MSRPHLLVRADASSRLGVGHVMRSLTLAEAATSRSFTCTLRTHALPPALRRRANDLGILVEGVTEGPGSPADAAATTREADLVVVDGYHLGGVVDALVRAGRPTLVVDDEGSLARPGVTLLLNQNPHAASMPYEHLAGTRCLLGPRYALVRREVLAAARPDRPRDVARQVLVSMGGADVAGLSAPLAAALVSGDELRVDVAIGMADARTDALRAELGRLGDGVRAVASSDLPSALAGADVAVLAAGSTLWEAAALGVPTVAVVVADNQAAALSTPAVAAMADVHDARRRAAVREIAEAALALCHDPTARRSMARAGRSLVDGRGADRVVDAIAAALDAESGDSPRAS